MKLENTSWSQVKKNKKIKFIQDPILNIKITKEYFEDVYKDILNKIDGNSENLKNSIEYHYRWSINKMESNKHDWNKIAVSQSKLIDFLKDNIHKEK